MAMQEKYSEDTVILNEKAVNNQMYMVISGTVALYLNYGLADEYLLGLCNKGTVFGEMGVLSHAPSMYTAVAVTEVVAATFSEHELGYFIKTYPENALGIMRSTARMSNILSLNLKMTLEEHKKEDRFSSIFADGYRRGNEQEILDDLLLEGKWHYI